MNKEYLELEQCSPFNMFKAIMNIEMLYTLDSVKSLSVFMAMCEGQLRQ